MTLYMIIEPVHLLPEVKCQCNSYIIVYFKSIIRNYSIAGKRGHWPASKDISLPYLTLTFWMQYYAILDLWVGWGTAITVLENFAVMLSGHCPVL